MKRVKKANAKNKAKKIQHEELKEVSGGSPQTQTCTYFENGSLCTGQLGPVDGKQR